MSTERPYPAVGRSQAAPLLPHAPKRPKGTMQNPTPLPKAQIFAVAFMRFSEPLSIWVIFPFINEMVHSTGIVAHPEEVGYYSGLVESAYASAQFLTSYFWGATSDRIGRKPVLCIGLCGLIVGTIIFGFSKTYAMILAVRFIAAGFNGNAAVGKCVLGELTDETNQAQAFSFLSPAWAIGSIIAPMIGGYLSRPAERFPQIFGSWDLLRTFPYLLPCLAAACCTCSGLAVGLFLLKETLPTKIREKAALKPPTELHGHPHRHDYGALTTFPIDTEEEPPIDAGITLSEMLRIPSVRRVLLSYTLLGLITVCVDSIWVLWMYTPLKSGGLQLTPSQIGTVMSSCGVLSTFVGLVLFPWTQRRIGTTPIYRFCMSLYVVIVILFPIVHRAALVNRVWAFVGVALMGTLKSLAGTVFACVMIIVNKCAPSRTSLGRVNGAAQTSASMMRTVGPTMASTLFALSNHKGWGGGMAVYFVLGTLALMSATTTFFVEEATPEEQRRRANPEIPAI